MVIMAEERVQKSHVAFLKTLDALGFAIPQPVPLRTEEVIE